MRVLCVDDDEALLELEKAFLEDEQLSVETATSGPEAARRLQDEDFDAVISDYQMPEMDGIELLKSIRSWSYLPFILFTGKGREEVVIEALNSGADFYAKKGGDVKAQFAELKNLVHQAVARRQAEEAVQYNLQRFRALIENSSDVILVFDGKGVVTFVTPSVQRVLGYEPGEIIGRPLAHFVDPAQAPRLTDVLTRTLANKTTPGLVRFRVRHKDGTLRELEAIGSVQEQKGEASVIANVRDVTERIRMEAELRLSVEHFRAAFDQSPAGATTADLEGRYLRANKAFCEMLGYQEEELMGLSFAQVTDPSFVEEQRAAIERLVAGEMPGVHMEKRYLRRDGGTVWCNTHISLIRDRQRKPFCLLAVSEDMTERRTALEQLREANQTLRALLSGSSDAAFLIDREGRYLAVNEPMARLMRLPPEKIVGRTAAELMPPDVWEARKAMMEKVLEARQRQSFAEEARGRSYVTTITPVVGAEGKIDRLAVFVRDTTEEEKSRQSFDVPHAARVGPDH